jgi:LAS superfamily LD-carboxypeptidase LdcB
VSSGYRSVESQLGLWQTNFPRYYDDTSTKRAAAPGGAHGEQAARLMARYIGGRLGAPGYSLHNDGRAVDLRAEVVDGNPLRADSRQSKEWRRSWLFSWLVGHAGLFGFHQNDAIDEPWHWEYRAVP